MKKVKKILICLLCLVVCVCSVGCSDEKKALNTKLNEEQTNAYQQVVDYANGVSPVEDILVEVKIDIAKAKNLEIEISIGKLKIDKVKLKRDKEKALKKAEDDAESDRVLYQYRMNAYSDRYYGTSSQYTSEMNDLQGKLASAYSSYLSDIRVIENSNATAGYKEAQKTQRYNQYLREANGYQSQREALQKKWDNKVEYEKYEKLYNNVYSALASDKRIIENNYQEDLSEIESKIRALVLQR